MEPGDMQDEAIRKMGHLMRRAGFGASYRELQDRSRKGIDGTIRELLDDASDPEDHTAADHFLEELIAQNPQQRLNPQMLKPWWIYRMVATEKPLLEKMTLFWHGHFATSYAKVGNPDLMVQQNRLFRELALGNWRTMLKAVSRDPAMIIWLDNNQNDKAHPNENYGRELMELFCLGIGNYTETDVKQGSRAFTGWSQVGGSFSFNAARHDTGDKVFLGQQGNFDGDNIIDIILDQPAASEFITRKLFTYLAYANPEPAVVKDLAAQFRRSNFELRTLVEAILKSDAFWSAKNFQTQIKSPAQYIVGTLRALNLGALAWLPEVNGEPGRANIRTGPQRLNGRGAMPEVGASMTAETMNDSSGRMGSGVMTDETSGMMRPGMRGIWQVAAQSCARMGQDLFNPPNVKGWDGGDSWINAATVLERINYANSISGVMNRFGPQLVETVAGPLDVPADELVRTVLNNLGPITVSEDVRKTLLQAVGGQEAGVMPIAGGFERRGRVGQRARSYQEAARVRTLLAAALSTAQYQVC